MFLFSFGYCGDNPNDIVHARSSTIIDGNHLFLQARKFGLLTCLLERMKCSSHFAHGDYIPQNCIAHVPGYPLNPGVSIVKIFFSASESVKITNLGNNFLTFFLRDWDGSISSSDDLMR